MKAGLFLLACYLGYGVATYGAPELKVIGVAILCLYVGISMVPKEKAKVSRRDADKL